MTTEVIDYSLFDVPWRFFSQVQLHCFPKGDITRIGFYKSKVWAREKTDEWSPVTDQTFRPPDSGQQRKYEVTLTMDSSLIELLTQWNYAIFCGITGKHGSTSKTFRFEFPNHEINNDGIFDY